MSYEDKVLLSLRRKYSRDETVSALSKKVSTLEVENGKLKAEIDYLNDKASKEKKAITKQVRKELKKSIFSETFKALGTKDKKIKIQKQDIENLILELNKYKKETINEITQSKEGA